MEPVSRAARISGWIISSLIALFMLADGVGHTARFATYVKGTIAVGYPDNVIMPLGIVVLVCSTLYLIPSTSVLGAILLTAYFGGATATLVRVGQPFYFPIVFGILTWLGLYLRDRRIRALVPLSRE